MASAPPPLAGHNHMLAHFDSHQEVNCYFLTSIRDRSFTFLVLLRAR
jgi:hypothetical protein